MPTRFLDCIDGGRNLVDDWLRQQPPAVRARFYDDFKHLAVVPKTQWVMPRTRMLRGVFSRLREFRVRIGRVHYRLAGFHEPGDVVVLCPGWTHSQNEAIQKSAMKRALDLRERFEKGQVTTGNHVP